MPSAAVRSCSDHLWWISHSTPNAAVKSIAGAFPVRLISAGRRGPARLAVDADAKDQSDAATASRKRAQRIAFIAQAVGAVVLSRSCPDNSLPADEILSVCREQVLAKLE